MGRKLATCEFEKSVGSVPKWACYGRMVGIGLRRGDTVCRRGEESQGKEREREREGEQS